MNNVYFKAIDSYSKTEEISNAASELLKELVKEENISLEKFIPLKVHFGEKGNNTFIKSKNFAGIINYEKEIYNYNIGIIFMCKYSRMYKTK